MTKQEMFDKIADIYSAVDSLYSDYSDLSQRIKEIRTSLEELPDESDLEEESKG